MCLENFEPKHLSFDPENKYSGPSQSKVHCTTAFILFDLFVFSSYTHTEINDRFTCLAESQPVKHEVSRTVILPQVRLLFIVLTKHKKPRMTIFKTKCSLYFGSYEQ